MMPAAAPGAGIGHLQRGARVTAQVPGAAVAVPADERESAAKVLAELQLDVPLCDWQCADRPFDVVVLDRRSTSVAQMLMWTRGGLGVGLDEGGAARRYLPLLLDTVPRRERHPPNAAELRWALTADGETTNLPTTLQSTSATLWLVTFGGDDPAHLSEQVAAALLRLSSPGTRVAVVSGPRFGDRDWPDGVDLLPPQSSLAPLLRRAALVCTAYGLTAYEALAAGTPVVLANPSRYHQRLAEASAIPSLGDASKWRPALERRLASLLAHPDQLRAAVAAVASQLTRSPLHLRRELPDVLQSLRASGPPACPSCGSTLSPAVARFSDRTYRRCRRCRLVHMLRFEGSASPVTYHRSYFFDQYRAQYGRTYLEDFTSIRATGYDRLRHIARLQNWRGGGRAGGGEGEGERERPRLLDVGCAYGPFLDAARRRGWDPAGVDVSAEAVQHVTSQLHLPAIIASVEELRTREVEELLGAGAGAKRFQAVTMWYVIEHLVDLGHALRLTKRLLDDHGVLAFSTPNGGGISRLRSLRHFLARSPRDHYTVWTPRSAREVLRRYGFRVRRTRVTGHHPERFPLAAGPGVARAVYRVLASFASRVLRLGDTFEVYATALPVPLLRDRDAAR